MRFLHVFATPVDETVIVCQSPLSDISAFTLKELLFGGCMTTMTRSHLIGLFKDIRSPGRPWEDIIVHQ